MKRMFLIFIFLISSFLIIVPSAFSQFLNSNHECEVIPIIESGYSVACKNVYSSLNNENSFTGGIYPDCAVATSDDVGVLGTPNVSVILNKGTGATVCTNAVNGDQFNLSADYVFSGLVGTTFISTLVVGNLSSPNNPMGLADIAILNTNTTIQISSENSAVNGSGSFTGATNNVSALAAGTTQVIENSSTIERAMGLFYCNNDQYLDAAAAVRETAPVEGLFVNISLNNANVVSSALTAVSSSINTGLQGTAIQGSLAIGDFNNDGFTDIVTASRFGTLNGISVCLNNGSCGFTCTVTQYTPDHVTAPDPRSIVAGDFNGDGKLDVAITESAGGDITAGIHYYFGNGLGGFSSNQHASLAGDVDGTPTVLTTGCFNSDSIVDVALSVNGDGDGTGSGVALFELDSNSVLIGGVPVNLTFTTGTTLIGGIDAADFDRNGRDDVMVKGTRAGDEQAYVFMNATAGVNGTVIATITTAPGAVLINTSYPLSGTCANADGTTSTFQALWSITSPNAANASITNPTSFTNAQFTATVPGTYSVALTCTAPCGSAATSRSITVVAIPARDQGGCASNSLIPFSGPVAFSGFLPLLGSLGIWGLKRRRNRKNSSTRLFSSLLILLVLLVFAKVGEATVSFPVNFFKPAVDDSEYISVYGSPLMKKKYYHAGFYLDYARHPYEFGDPSYNRIGSITNNLLTGNFLGSYAIFDWLNAGGRLPVYFWNGLNPVALGRGSENKIDLGDFELDLKIRLIDRQKHGIGWSLLPFITIPTATRVVNDYTGDGALSGGFKMILDGKPHDRVAVSLNVGYQARRGVITPGGSRIDDHFLLGAGVSGDVIKEKLKVIAETQVETVVYDFFSERQTTPAEARLAFRYMFPKLGIDVNAGGGMGYTNGIASPDFRLFAGVTYTKRPIAKVAIQEDIGEVKVGDELKLADKIYFEFDKATIRDISKPTLDKVAAFIKKHSEIKKLRVEGNTCDLGTAAYNQRLSERRANAVVNYLVEQGVSQSIFHAVGYGESKPAVPNTDEANREQNRRVQFFVEEK